VFVQVDFNMYVLSPGVATGVYMQQLGYTFMVQFAGCIASLVAVTLVAVVLDLFGNYNIIIILYNICAYNYSMRFFILTTLILFITIECIKDLD